MPAQSVRGFLDEEAKKISKKVESSDEATKDGVYYRYLRMVLTTLSETVIEDLVATLPQLDVMRIGIEVFCRAHAQEHLRRGQQISLLGLAADINSFRT